MMSKNVYVGIYAGSLGLFLLVLLIVVGIFVLGVSANRSGINMAIGVGLNLGILALLQFMVVHTVFNFVMLARMWGAIQDGQTQITVGKAIGFLFIPFFSIYWIFRAWGSFPTEYNKYADRYGLSVPRLSNGIFVTYPILVLLSGLIVPFLILPFVFLAMISKNCDAVNTLSKATQARRGALMPRQAQTPFTANA